MVPYLEGSAYITSVKKMFVAQKDKVSVWFVMLHNKELCPLYRPPGVRTVGWAYG
jgi:hypothetical protein